MLPLTLAFIMQQTYSNILFVNFIDNTFNYFLHRTNSQPSRDGIPIISTHPLSLNTHFQEYPQLRSTMNLKISTKHVTP